MPLKSGASSSSMHTTTSLSSSWVTDGSPSRHSPSRNGIRTPGRERPPGALDRSTERRRATIDREPNDSPSRQMLVEFSQMLIRNDREFHDRLDQTVAEAAKVHNEQLSRAALEHEKVRQSAERERQRLILEQEQLRIRQEEEQKIEIERLKREKAKLEAEAEQRRLETEKREEETRRQAVERERQMQETETRLKARKEQEEVARKQQLAKQEADRKAKEAAIAAEKARIQALPPPVEASQANLALARRTATAVTPAAAPSTSVQPPISPDIEDLHNRYLQLHYRLKEFRKTFYEEHKGKGDPLKDPIGDTRREIRQRMGQITTNRQDSKDAITRIRNALNKVLTIQGPTLDIRMFIISHRIPTLANEAEAQVSALLVYSICCFVKFLLKQFDQEAPKEDGRIIQELGLLGASLFADQNYMWKGIMLTDILIAKYHKACPVLFGISGDATTEQGLLRLGWKKGMDMNAYNQRQMGLGAGFAALSLRQFTAKAPAVPMSEYWRAVSSICNTPSATLSSAHFMALKGLLSDYALKFVTYYGLAALGVLRRATIDLPNRAPPHASKEASLVKVLPDVFRNKYNLSFQ